MNMHQNLTYFSKLGPELRAVHAVAQDQPISGIL